MARYFVDRRLAHLPKFYQTLFRTWQTLNGGLSRDGFLSLRKTSDTPLPLENISSRNVYSLLHEEAYVQPYCVVKFAPVYGPLYWSQTWAQLHMCSLDRRIVDLDWQIAHGVLYTGARLALDFHMATINPRCFCDVDDETLEHLFFQCQFARLLLAWVFSRLLDCDPTAARFTVQELLFGFSEARRRVIPSIILYMLQVMKHTIWVARCDFRFRNKPPVPYECLQRAKAKLKFILSLLRQRCRSPSQIRAFEREWLARGTPGHLEGEELVFSF